MINMMITLILSSYFKLLRHFFLKQMIKSNDIQSHEEGFALTLWTNIGCCVVVQNKKQCRLIPQSWNFPLS